MFTESNFSFQFFLADYVLWGNISWTVPGNDLQEVNMKKSMVVK